MIASVRHRIAHALGWNAGIVVSGHGATGVYIGFGCLGCGRIEGYHRAPEWIQR